MGFIRRPAAGEPVEPDAVVQRQAVHRPLILRVEPGAVHPVLDVSRQRQVRHGPRRRHRQRGVFRDLVLNRVPGAGERASAGLAEVRVARGMRVDVLVLRREVAAELERVRAGHIGD